MWTAFEVHNKKFFLLHSCNFPSTSTQGLSLKLNCPVLILRNDMLSFQIQILFTALNATSKRAVNSCHMERRQSTHYIFKPVMGQYFILIVPVFRRRIQYRCLNGVLLSPCGQGGKECTAVTHIIQCLSFGISFPFGKLIRISLFLPKCSTTLAT